MSTKPEHLTRPLYIESLDLEAQGVAHKEDGRVVFVEGALPFEQVHAQVHRVKENWGRATLTKVLKESSQRVAPQCPHFGLHKGACGGCKMQHLDSVAQVAIKNRALQDMLWHLAKVRAQTWLPAICGLAWGYRFRARLAVRYVAKKATVLVGFHERKSRYIADMQSCAVLAPAVSALLLPLRALIASLQACTTCPQIEVAVGEHTVALVLRHLQPLSETDLHKLRLFAQEHADIGLQWWLQAHGPDSIQRLDSNDGTPDLAYTLPEFGIYMPFRPTDFTQVNPVVNQVLVRRTLRLLAVQKCDRVIDWFCGLGNFTLPLATQAGCVLGVEGSESLVTRAQDNFDLNPNATAPTRFVHCDLFTITAAQLYLYGAASKWLIDPPREGALALCEALADLQQPDQSKAENIAKDAAQPPWYPPHRIVYVSCNPATLARDAAILVHKAGYRLVRAGVVNMFAHTAHIESLVVFEKENTSL